MKREMFRKLMAASLATVMVAGLASCGDNNDAPGASDSPQPSVSNAPSNGGNGSDGNGGGNGEDVSPYPIMKDANGNKYDLGGAEVYIYTWFGEGRTEGPYQDALDEYREWAQKEYNFTMTWDSSGNWGMHNDFADLASGVKDTEGKLRFYMLPADQATVVTAMHGNLMWNLSSLGVFDFTEHRWTVNHVSDLYRMNGDVYACAVGAPEPRTGIFFNATLLEQLTGITADDMYDLQKNDEWTWAKFEEICELIYQNGDTNNDGVQDIYAIAGNTGYVYNEFVHANNAMLFKLGDDGKFVYMADDPATVAGLEFQLKLRTAPYWLNQAEGQEWDYFYDAFDQQGTIVFLPEQAYHINDGNQLNQNDETNVGEYGFLLFPKGPNAPKGIYMANFTDNIMAIPKCYTEEEAKIIAAAYNIWTADVIPGFIGYNSRLDGYENGVYHSRALTETLTRMMSEGAMIDTSGLLPGANRDVWNDTSKTISEIIAENESAWKAAIDDFNNKQ